MKCFCFIRTVLPACCRRQAGNQPDTGACLIFVILTLQLDLVNKNFAPVKLLNRNIGHILAISLGDCFWANKKRKKLRGYDSNVRPSGYEPDELPLLYPATFSSCEMSVIEYTTSPTQNQPFPPISVVFQVDVVGFFLEILEIIFFFTDDIIERFSRFGQVQAVSSVVTLKFDRIIVFL